VHSPAGAIGGAVQAPGPYDLAVVIPAKHELDNLQRLLPELRAALTTLTSSSQILIVTAAPNPAAQASLAGQGASLIVQPQPGYGSALRAGFAAANARWVLTMDGDLTQASGFIERLWNRRHAAEVIIASRYAKGGSADVSMSRYVLSRALNVVFSRGLSLKVRDMSSGVRLYNAEAIRHRTFRARNFDILQEILLLAYADGWRVEEVPFDYKPRRDGSSNARVVKFGLAYARTFWTLWKMRNSILAADYDARAHDSAIPLQRYWQRERYRHVTDLIAGEGRVLDVGCGSSQIIGALPAGSVGVDVLLRKLRYARRFSRPLVQASGFQLPFPGQSFPCVLCSQVIEHVPKESPILDELERVLAPGGRLVLGTPDYANWQWRLTERLYGLFAPGGYADEHIGHYTRAELVARYQRLGYSLESVRYILKGELILAFRKPAAPPSGPR
jgi:ubiquinone/menaquinone biosynthesis C-methylase UbiE